MRDSSNPTKNIKKLTKIHEINEICLNREKKVEKTLLMRTKS